MPQFVKPTPERTLQVVAYNVHLLPRVALPFAGQRSNASYRSEAIARNLLDYDLIALSEVFQQSSRKRLTTTLQEFSDDAFTISSGPARSGRHLTNSGLMLYSKYPIVTTHTKTYVSASRLMTHGLKSDGFAAKGVLHIRILVDQNSGANIDCFLTHLESQSPEARAGQVAEFCEFVEAHQDPNVPVLLMGDFNIAYRPSHVSDPSDAYCDLHSRLAALRPRPVIDAGLEIKEGPKGTSDAMLEDGGDRIDFVFFSNGTDPESVRLRLHRYEHIPFQDNNVPEGSLSDHLAVACEFAIVSDD
ncbi:MAG: endonuclease/exonuclease/phosphatase family protein [Aureliella sp.]